MAGTPSKDLLHGTLDSLILKTLSRGSRHGYAIARWIENVAGDALRIEEGSLYPALYRLQKRGWIEAEWGVSELNRRVKLYHLTPKGKEQLTVETERWQQFVEAVSAVLLAEEPAEVAP